MEKPDQRFPFEWDEDRVRRVLEHYENQTGAEAAAEEAAALEGVSRASEADPPHDRPG